MTNLQAPQVEWVTIKKLSELTGLSVESIRANIKKGQFLIDYHWRKQCGRIYINTVRFNEWVEGKPPRNTRA